jgi:hypothetical protein
MNRLRLAISGLRFRKRIMHVSREASQPVNRGFGLTLTVKVRISF